MTGGKRPSRWAERTLRAFDDWYHLGLSPVAFLGFLAPRNFWRWRWWAKLLFVIVTIPVVFALMMLFGC